MKEIEEFKDLKTFADLSGKLELVNSQHHVCSRSKLENNKGTVE